MHIRLMWVSLLLIAVSCTPKVTKKVAEKEQPPPPSALSAEYVIKENINMRSGPSVKYPVIGKLEDGDEVFILDNKKGWYRIQTGSKIGWVRSDLVGPRNLSRIRMASAFNDSIMSRFKGSLYIDKNKPYQIIYLELNEPNHKRAKKLASQIGKLYQEKVYPGKLTVNLIKPGASKYYDQIVLPALGIADIPLPVLDFGYLEKLKSHNSEVALYVVVPDSVDNQRLLKLARKIASKYSYPFTKSEVIMRSVSSDGNVRCRLYYVEDGYGENFVFNRCGRQ